MDSVEKKLKHIHDINFAAFSKIDVAKYYSEEELQKTEEVVINKIRNKIENGKFLEIGVGAGKTIDFLTSISSEYIGIDYSEAMVNECKRRFPGINVLQCDAREMSIFADGEFDFVLCAFNGMDYVSHEDRLKILSEVFRVLKKGGHYVFSTHNRDCIAYPSFLSSFSAFKTFNMKQTISRIGGCAGAIASLYRSILNHWKNNSYVIHTDEYSFINDKGHEYSLMTYYIPISNQKMQLEKIGFSSNVRAFDKDGLDVTGDCPDTWIYYLANK